MSINGRIIGYGWIAEDIDQTIGFAGWAMGALRAKNIWVPHRKTFPNGLKYEDILNGFQFALSDNYFWYSPPTRFNAGYSCNPLLNFDRLISELEIYIKGDFDPAPYFFENINFNWDWPERL